MKTSNKLSVLITILLLSINAFNAHGLTVENTVAHIDIVYHLPSDSTSLISFGGEGVNQQAPVIKYPAQHPIVKGTFIIIDELQTQGNNSAALLQLARLLPHSGWNTMLLSPSNAQLLAFKKHSTKANTDDVNTDKSKLTESVQSNANENSVDSASNDSEIAEKPDQTSTHPQTGLMPWELQNQDQQADQKLYSEFLNALSQSVLAELGQASGRLIIFAKGKSAASFVKILANDETTQSSNNSLAVDALIVQSPYWPSISANNLVAKNLSEINQPVLDLISAKDNYWSKQTIDKRKQSTYVSLKTLYRQRSIDDITHAQIRSSDAKSIYFDSLAKEIVSWTYYLGW